MSDTKRVEVIPWFKGHAIKVLTEKTPCAWDPSKFDTEHQIRSLTVEDLRRLRDEVDAALSSGRTGESA